MKKNLREEGIISQLTKLFESRGFQRYKPSCFEEYALYQENKDFLIGKNVITFSGSGGKLLAMRPDVTLSLIKHSDVAKGEVEKYFYNEKVYRQTSVGKEFKEISQTGAEVIGALDGVCETEIICLACDTLSSVTDSYVLDISHMGYTEGLFAQFGCGAEQLSNLLMHKNLHDFYKLAEEKKFDKQLVRAFEVVINVNGPAEEALKQAKSVALNDKMKNAIKEMEMLYARLKKFGYGDKINVNFSISNNADYYNGVIFNGYIDGVAHRVLSGGRYDKLIEKLGKNGGAIGFALYLGEIDRFFAIDEGKVDAVIFYDDESQEKALEKSFELSKKGKTFCLCRGENCGCRYGEIIDLRGGRKQ